MKKIVIANWKCNPVSLVEAKKLFYSVDKSNSRADIVICPPFVYLESLSRLKNKVKLGAQDCFWRESGAYTGEVSPLMLKNIGCRYVIVGHSERRRHWKETDEIVERKFKVALATGLKPILCIDKISQIGKNIRKCRSDFIIAYEPLFAIGSGQPCHPKKAEKVGNAIREKIKRRIPILYGGSVNSFNVTDYLGEEGFDGLLVGGASLKPKEFLKIIKTI